MILFPAISRSDKMLNYWWVTRPKRKLNSIPEVLSTFAEVALDQEWQGQRTSHLSSEDMLEKAGLKRKGDRRDQTGGGARTYQAWVVSLGLIFVQQSTGKIKLTLAGEAIMNGDNPVDVLKNQVLKYQFPSNFSTSTHVNVSERFQIHPFIFMLRLLADTRIGYLSEEELAKIVVVEAENESDQCFQSVVSRILQFRDQGDACLDPDFAQKYAPSKRGGRENEPYAHLMDLANTLFNWLEYTQLAKREEGKIAILPDKQVEVSNILDNPPKLIDRPREHEYFQRRYGVDPKHKKDTRNLTASTTVTAQIIAEQKIKNTFIALSLCKPIASISSDLIDQIASTTGIDPSFVEQTLHKFYPKGSIGAFMAEYFEMAFKGRQNATEFERATVAIFNDVFHFSATHVGPIGLTPDALILSDTDGYCAIIDNKAYPRYSITNDHHNRMVHNYIKNLSNYYTGAYNLAFFSYIAGGFGTNIDRQIHAITSETGICGSAISVTNMIELVKRYDTSGYDHSTIKDIFSVGRQVSYSDLP